MNATSTSPVTLRSSNVVPPATMPHPDTTMRVPWTPGMSTSRAESQISSYGGTTGCTVPSRGSWRPARSVRAVASTVCPCTSTGRPTPTAATIALVLNVDHSIDVGSANLDGAAGQDRPGVTLHTVRQLQARVMGVRRRWDAVARAAGDRAHPAAPHRPHRPVAPYVVAGLRLRIPRRLGFAAARGAHAGHGDGRLLREVPGRIDARGDRVAVAARHGRGQKVQRVRVREVAARRGRLAVTARAHIGA